MIAAPNIVNFNGTSHTVMTGQTEKTVYNKAGRLIQKRYSDRGVNMYRNTVVNYDGDVYSAPIDFKQTKLYFGDTPRMYVMDSSKLRNFNKVLG